MQLLELANPFGAPVYHEEIVSSTMDVSRVLAANGAPRGTVIAADYQEAGRGRIRGRAWETEKAGNLLFTILLRFGSLDKIPAALPLRTGLAIALAIEDFAPALAGGVMVKWPNDVMINAKKAAGILCEAENGNAHIGVGVNVGQRRFPDSIQGKTISIAMAGVKANGGEITGDDRFALLEYILARLYEELEEADSASGWKERLEERLYQRGEQVVFAEGAADSPKMAPGAILGIGPGGELLIDCGSSIRSFTAGEII